jgi:hypothetical protein
LPPHLRNRSEAGYSGGVPPSLDNQSEAGDLLVVPAVLDNRSEVSQYIRGSAPALENQSGVGSHSDGESLFTPY